MGRGRAKAKQTKVARELKYRTFETDFDDAPRCSKSSLALGTRPRRFVSA